MSPYAFANIAASQTDATVIAAIPGKSIRVLSIAFVTGATATNITLNTKPDGAGTAITCLYANAANGGAALPSSGNGWFQTNVGEGLSATTGAGSTTGIQLVWIPV